eukprot:CAMPEP_0170742368 /NCGR_PEP_ID=MMETSP0437-20130122/6706_1 /TAXON_ID=0 /ORGANISM="Sexangularia sp." /LENGTH=105 /DNA_ID=CAMNT_0011080983 /DNA_START=78 /DNA_END=395 /DNA_ORIENTATION=-
MVKIVDMSSNTPSSLYERWVSGPAASVWSSLPLSMRQRVGEASARLTELSNVGGRVVGRMIWITLSSVLIVFVPLRHAIDSDAAAGVAGGAAGKGMGTQFVEPAV